MEKPQTEIMCAFIRGETLTVLDALKKYHTTELRRIVSRINKIFLPDNQMVLSFNIPGKKYKLYRLVKTNQMELQL